MQSQTNADKQRWHPRKPNYKFNQWKLTTLTEAKVHKITDDCASMFGKSLPLEHLLHNQHRLVSITSHSNDRPNSTPLTPLLEGSDMLIKVGLYWHTGAILAGCPSCRHQWLIQVPVGVESRYIGCKYVALTTEARLLHAVSTSTLIN